VVLIGFTGLPHIAAWSLSASEPLRNLSISVGPIGLSWSFVTTLSNIASVTLKLITFVGSPFSLGIYPPFKLAESVNRMNLFSGFFKVIVNRFEFSGVVHFGDSHMGKGWAMPGCHPIGALLRLPAAYSVATKSMCFARACLVLVLS
jgi:hypothetical protein